MNAIKDLRMMRGMTQTELAARLGVSPQMLCNYERGSSRPGPKMLPALADALGVSAAYLRGDAQRLAVYDRTRGCTAALPIVAETVLDDYGVFYLVDHPEVGIMAVILSDGVQFTLSDWQDKQPMTIAEIAAKRWVDGQGCDAVMYQGLPFTVDDLKSK